MGENFLRKCGFSGEIFNEEFYYSIRAHHKKYRERGETELLKIVEKADHYDASQRGETEEEAQRYEIGLSSYFNEEIFYVPTLFSSPFEKQIPRKKISNHDPTRTDLQQFYKDVFSLEKKENEDVFRQIANHRCSEDVKFENTLMAMREFCSFVPSFTQDKCKISLYDHCKNVSAIGLCLYRYNKETGKEWEGESLLLLRGDMSGIQSFLSSMKSKRKEGEDYGKRLRGRSFLIEVVCDIVVRHILLSLNLTYDAVVFSSAGNFVILCPNTPSVVENVGKLEREISEYMLDTFGCVLRLTLAAQPFSPKLLDFEKPESGEKTEFYKEVLEPLDKKISVKKTQQILHMLDKLGEWQKPEKGGSGAVCDYCEAGIEQGNICELCDRSDKIGKSISGTSPVYLIISDSRIEEKEERCHVLKTLGKTNAILTTDLRAAMERNRGKKLFVVAYIYESFEPFAKNYYEALKKIVEGGYDVSFVYKYHAMSSGKNLEEIAMLDTEGGKEDTYLGHLIMDVDNLGSFFKKFRILADMSAFSNQLDLFFSKGVSTIMGKEGAGNVYTVFSGGDDLYLISRWDRALDLAEKIREKLYEFSGEGLKISGGIAVFKPKFPIYKAHPAAKEEEISAKSVSGKNAISIFRTGMKWDEDEGNFKDLKKFALEIKDEKKLSNQVLYTILSLLRSTKKRKEEGGHSRTKAVLLIRYIFGRRMGKDKSMNEKLANLFEKIINKRNSELAIALALMYRALEKNKGEVK